MVSPYQANRRVPGMPPSLLVTHTREALLSSTADFCEALLRGGTKPSWWSMKHYRARFWYCFPLPETRECLDLAATFYDR